MRNIRLYVVSIFIGLCFNTLANDTLNYFCNVVKNAMPMINQERARFGLKPLEFKYIIDKDKILLSYLRGWGSTAYDSTSEYVFEVTMHRPEYALYYEEGLGGYCSISKNTAGEESRINIELLFNYINSKK